LSCVRRGFGLLGWKNIIQTSTALNLRDSKKYFYGHLSG